MILPVSLFSIDQSRVALMADISHSGCRLQGVLLPNVGHEVLLKTADFELFGRIVWKAGDERGVKFDELISEAVLANLRELRDQQ
jgi:hypothetical protein